MKYYMFNGIGNGESKSIKGKRQLNKSKIWKLIVVSIFVVLLIMFIFLYTTNEKCREVFDKYIFRKEAYENNLPFIKIDSAKNTNIYAYDKYVTVLEENKLKLFNKSGNEEHCLDIEISSPIFEAKGQYLAIAEKNGQKIYLISNKNIVWQKDIEGSIGAISINKNGYVSVTITGTSYKTVVATYDSNGNELFKKYLSTTNVIDTDISNDNKYLAIAEANFSGIVVQSSIEVISIEDAQKNSSESIKYTHLAEANDLIININYRSKNELICMYDEHIDIFTEGQNNELLNFKDEDVLFSDINLPTKIIKVIKKSTGLFSTAEAEMKIISNDIENPTIYAIENVPKKIDVQDNMIAINLGTSVLFVNSNGWLVKRYQSYQEIQKIVFCDNIAGIIFKNKIEFITL